MTADAGVQALVGSLVLNLLLQSLAQVFKGFCLLLDGGGIFAGDGVNHVYDGRVVDNAADKAVVQNETVQVVGDTATDIGPDYRDKGDGVGQGQVAVHGHELGVGHAKRGSCQFNLYGDFSNFPGSGGVVDVEARVVRAELDVVGGLDVKDGQQVDPQLETESLHGAAETLVAKIDARGDFYLVGSLHLGAESGGVVAADTDDSKGLGGKQCCRCKYDFKIHSVTSVKLYKETI